MALHEDLRSAFEEEGYEVAEASENRGHVRVSILEEDADPDALRAVVTSVIDEEQMIGWSTEPETTEGEAGVATVVTFRTR